jgi:hypothetical protein
MFPARVLDFVEKNQSSTQHWMTMNVWCQIWWSLKLKTAEQTHYTLSNDEPLALYMGHIGVTTTVIYLLNYIAWLVHFASANRWKEELNNRAVIRINVVLFHAHRVAKQSIQFRCCCRVEKCSGDWGVSAPGAAIRTPTLRYMQTHEAPRSASAKVFLPRWSKRRVPRTSDCWLVTLRKYRSFGPPHTMIFAPHTILKETERPTDQRTNTC